MKLTLWKPAEDINLLDEFDWFVPQIFKRTDNLLKQEGWNWSPTADVVEKEDSYEIRTELPGVKREEIQVTFNDGILSIKGERKHLEEKKKKNEYLYKEIFEGAFERNFRFSEIIQEDKISAEYKNGVLTVMIPKSEHVKPHSVDIK